MIGVMQGTRGSPIDSARKRSDYILLATVVALSAFGLTMVYSATRFANQRREMLESASMERQLIFVVAGLILMIGLSLVDYRDLKYMLPMLYGGVVAGLVAVFLFDDVQGARRWIDLKFFKLQPAEFAKLVAVLGLASLFTMDRESKRLTWKRIFQSLVMLGPLTFLVLVEPDLATTLVFVWVWFVMVFLAGARWKQITLIVSVAIGSVVYAVMGDRLMTHQMNRLRIWRDPYSDPLNLGYQLIQSRRAVGAGQLFGQGLFNGNQTNLAMIPEQENDFIFTAIGEQLGFVGGLLVLMAFLVVVWRLLVIATNSKDRFGALVAGGFAAMIGFHVFVHIGVTIGVTPPTGIPLPFVSAGGSFYLTMAAAIGIANSIWIRRSALPGERHDL